MSVGQPCIHCREGHIRPFQFSLDQAILRCDNAACDSLFEGSPWEKVINRNIRQQIPRRSSDFGQYRLWGGSSSSSGVQSDIRSPLLSPAQSFGSVTDKEVELLLRKSYAPPKPTKHLRRSQEKCPSVTNPVKVSPTKSQSPMLKTDSKCDSFFELLSNLDLESPAHPVKGDSPSLSSLDDVVTAELESWMKGFEYPESIHIDGVSDRLHSNSVEVNPTSAEPNLLKPEEAVSDLCLLEEQRCIIPSQKSAFSQVSPKREKRVLNSDASQYISAFEENEDITKILAESIQENFSNPDSLICTLGSSGDPAKDDLSLLCDSQFLSPAASAASDDSGYNEEDANKLATVTLPQLQENNKLSSCPGSFESSDVEVNETAKCKSVATSSPFNLKNLTLADLEVSAPQDIHFNIHPAMVTVEKSVTVNDPPGVEPGSVEPNEDGGSLPVNQSTSDGELASTADDERDVEASNPVDFEKKMVENIPNSSSSCSVENTPNLSSSCSVENTPNLSSSCSVDLESNGSHSMSGDESILGVDGGATSVINSSQTSVIHEPCEDMVSVASSHSGSTLPSDTVEDEESKALCSDQSSDALSLCSGGSINQCKGNNRGRGRGRGRGKRRGRGKGHITSGYKAGNVRSSDSNQEVGNDGQPWVRGSGRGHGRGPGRGRGRGSLNILPGSSEFQPSKRPRVAAEMLHRQTRQRTGSIEVQASTAPRERSCERTTPVDSSDGSMRRGLSSLLQGQRWQIAEQKNSQHNQNFTNLSFRSLLSGSLARDPWSVMELYLEELDIEVVVQGTRSSPEVPSEGTSSPGTCRTTEEVTNNILQQKHDEESEERINEVKSKELQIDRSGLCTPMTDNNSVFKVLDDDAQVDVLSEKGRIESDIDYENPTSKEDKIYRSVTDDGHTTHTSTSKNEELHVVSKDLVLLCNENTDGMHVVDSHSRSNSSLPFARQDNDKMDNTIEISGDSQVLGFAQEHQQEQTKENFQDAKAYVSGEPEDLGITKEPHAIQSDVEPHSTHNCDVTGKEQICVLPNENVQSYQEFTLSDVSTKELMDSSTKCGIKDRQSGLKMDSQPLQVAHMPVKASTLAQGFREENQEYNIGIVNKLSKIIVDQEANSSVDSEVNIENKWHHFTFKGSEQCISLPIEKQISDKKISQIQLNTHQIALDIKGDTKETTLDLSETGQSLGRQNGSRVIQNPSHSKEFEVKNKSESFMNLKKCDTVKSHHPNAVVDLPINYECYKTKEVDDSLEEVHVLDVLKNFVQDCNGLVVRSGNNEEQLIKNRKNEDKGNNSITGCSSSSTQDIDATTGNELKKCNSPPSDSSPNASPYYLLMSPDSENVRSWMGHSEDSSLKEQAQKMPHLVDKDMQCTASLRKNKNAEATVKGSSKYFGSLLQDIDFDDKFFQCPVQEHPSKTFDEHISSSLFFGETASCSPPQTGKPESPKCVKSTINHDLDEKYRDTCYLEQDENCLGSNIQALQYPVCKVSEHCAAVNAISTTSTQIYSEPVHTNVALATFPTKLPEACTWIPSCSSLSQARIEGIAPTMKSHITNVSCDNETTNLPYTQTFTSSAVFSVPKTPYPTPSYSTASTTSVLPTIPSTIMTTVPSVMMDSVPTCSSIPETKVDTFDNKSERKKKHHSVKRHRRNVLRKEKNRNEDSQVINTDTSTRKCHCKARNEIHDSTYKTQDYLGATCAATGGAFRNKKLDQSGCDSKQGESSINLPSASVGSVVKTIDDRVVSVNVEEALHNVSGVSEITEKAEIYTVRLAETVPSGNVCIKQELKCFQSRNDCSDKYGDDKPANSQLPAIESMSVCDGEVNFIINAEKPGTSCDGDGDDDMPIISIDSEDEIQIIIPEKKCKYPKKTNDIVRKTIAEECVSNSTNSCIMQNSVGGNPEFIHKIKKEGGEIWEIFGCDGDLKMKSTFPLEQMCLSNQRGQKRMVEDVDEIKVIKKQRSISDIDSSSDDSCSKNGTLICGILDNSVVHDKKCFSPRVKDFVDFDENVRGSSDAQENKNFYSVSKKSGLKQFHDINAFGQFELGDTRGNEPSHILNQDDTLQGESLSHVFDSAIFSQDYKFGSTKSSPQHEIHPALKSDESSPGLLELDSTETGFLSMIITSPESCIASPEPLQQDLGSDSCNYHSVNSLEGIGSGHETSGIECRLTDGTEVGISGSESEETVQPTSDFETETSVYDGSEEESESECEDSPESCAQKPVSWSNMKIQVTDSKGKVQVIPNNVKQLQCVKTSHSLIPENLQDTCRPEKTGNPLILPSKYLTSQSPCVPVMPICPAMTSPSLISHAQFSKRAEERNLIANPQTHIIQPKTALSQGSTAEHQGQRLPISPFVPPAEPTDVHLRTLSSQSLMTTSASRRTNSTNVMQTHHYFSQHEKQESVIDYKTPISLKPLTIVPPALVPSYSDIVPTNMALTQTKTCLRGDTKSNSADIPQERIVAITSQTANGPVTRVLRVIKPSKEHSDHPKEHHCRNSSTDKGKHIPVESLSEKIKETCLENNMLKKVKMGSKGSFYMRPTSALKNALLEMRKKKSELDNKVQENAENSKFVELPDGEPIFHPLILPSERKDGIKSIKSKKRRKKIREKIKRERKTRKFVKEKVQETVERSKEDSVVPEMVVVCVGGKLHLYRRDIADTCTQ